MSETDYMSNPEPVNSSEHKGEGQKVRPKDNGKEARKPRASSATKRRGQIATYRFAVETTFGIMAAKPEVKSLLSNIVDSTENDKELALATLSVAPTVAEKMHLLSSLQHVDPFDLGVELVSMGRSKMRMVWSAIEVLTGVPGENLHQSDPKAAKQIAEGLREVSGADWQILSEAVKLLP